MSSDRVLDDFCGQVLQSSMGGECTTSLGSIWHCLTVFLGKFSVWIICVKICFQLVPVVSFPLTFHCCKEASSIFLMKMYPTGTGGLLLGALKLPHLQAEQALVPQLLLTGQVFQPSLSWTCSSLMVFLVLGGEGGNIIVINQPYPLLASSSVKNCGLTK